MMDGYIGPIIHQFTGNVKGSDLKNGVISSTATEVFPYFRPNPPIPFLWFHYCFMIYKQDNGVTDFSGYTGGKTKFDIPAVQATYKLSPITTNYFASHGTLWSSFVLNPWNMLIGLFS